MNGHQTHVVRRGFLTALVAVLLSVVISQAGAAEESTARKGLTGQASERAVVNFSEAAAQSSARPVSKKRRPDGRKRGGAGGEVSVASTPVAPSVAMASGEPLITAAGSVPSPQPSASFLALLDDASSFNPDTQGAVGPNHLMVTLSSQVRIQNRSGGVISTVSLDAFWGGLGNSTVFDPRVYYDRVHQKWITAAINNPGTNNSHVLLGISQTGDPTGSWYLHAIRVDTNDGVYASSPNIGLSRDWIIIQANMYQQTGQYYDYSDIFTFHKTNLYAGGVAAYHRWSHYPIVPLGVDYETATPVPAINYDDNYATNFLVANVGTFADGLGRLRLLSLSGPVNDPVFNEYNQVLYVAAGANFNFPGWASEAPGDGNLAPQLGTTNRIFISDSRIQNVVYRNGALWTAHHVFLPTNAPTRVAVQWWSFTTGGTVLQHGRMDDPSGTKMFAYPSIAVNRYEDVLIGYTRFAGNQYASANYAFHSYQESLGQLPTDTVLKAGEGKFTVDDNGLVLWGDWSGASVDPRNDTDLWTIQEYASAPVNSLERWGTWWGRVAPPTHLGVQVTDSPDPLIAGSNVTYSIQVTNFSSHLATGVRLTNALPTGAVFISAVASLGTCSHTNGVVVCDLGDVPGDALTNVVVTATIVARINQGGSATNRVTVGGHSLDEVPADNTALAFTAVTTASDLAVTLGASPGVVVLSNNVTLALTLTNRGPSSSSLTFLTNVLPAGLTFVSASSSQGSCTNLAGRVTCVFGTMAANAGAAASIVARVNVSAAHTIQATATHSALDPNLANNIASVVVQGNNLPVLQPISNRTINEDTVLGPIPFTISDVETLPENLVLGAFSSNPSIVPPQNIVFGGAGSSRDITITPALNANGAITITRTLTDSAGSVVSNAFVLSISNINDQPVISDILPQTINEDTVLGPLPFIIGDAETAAGSLTLTASSSAPALIPNANILFAGSVSNRTVRITPATNQSGSATITVTVSDGLLTAFDTFLVTVNPVNDLPTISDSPNRTINEDTPTPTIFFAVGDVETPVAALNPVGNSDNLALVPVSNIVFGGTGVSRTAVITPATNQFGTATITFSITDTNGGSRSDTFILTVQPVNDAPVLDAIPNLTTNEDAGSQVITLTGIGAGSTNETDTLTITVTSANPGLIPSPGILPHVQGRTTNAFTLTSAPNSNGIAAMTVSINDGRGSNNTVVRNFSVNIQAVNDAPTISAITNRTLLEDSNTGAIPFVIGDVESTPAFLVLSAASSDTNIVPVSNIVFSGGTGSNRLVTITPAPDQFGVVTNTIFVRDASATNSISFVLTVLLVNDLPSITSITNRSIDEDIAGSASFVITDKETAAGALALTASSVPPGLFPNLTFGGNGGNRSINLIPATNQSGSATITVAVLDADGGSNTTSFVVSVLPVNDPPTLAAISDLTLAEDSVVSPIVLSGITTGAPGEVQTLTVTALSTNTTLITNLVVTHTSPAIVGSLSFSLVPDAHGTGFVTVQVSDGNLTASRTFQLTITPVNDPPVVSQPANIETAEDIAVLVPLYVNDDETPANDLSILVTSSNPEVLDETGILLLGFGTNRVVELTPLGDQSGPTTITITVADGSNDLTLVSFDLTVLAVNDAPILSAIATQNLEEDAAAIVVSFTVQDAETPPPSLLVSAHSSNQSLLTDASLVPGGEGVNRTLSLAPLPDQYGEATVSVVLRESSAPEALSVTNTFLVLVTPVNDAPVLSTIVTQNLEEDAAATIVSFTVQDAETQPSNLLVSAHSSNHDLLPDVNLVLGGEGSSRTLSLTSLPDQYGSTTVSVVLRESAAPEALSVTNTFLVNVAAMNDAPTLDAIASLVLPKDADMQTVPLSGISMGAPNDDQTLSVSAVSSDTLVIPDPSVTYTSPADAGSLTFTPVSGATGLVQITVLVTEAGGATAGATNRLGRTFTVNVSGPGPALLVEFLNGEAIISWSTNSLLNWRLESSTNLNVPITWTPDVSQPVILGDKFTVTNVLNGVTRFYRLRNQ